MLYNASTKEKYDKVVNDLLKEGYRFPIQEKKSSFEEGKKYFHGNSKILIHTIAKTKEMVYTTKKIYLSYPQHTVKTFKEEMYN